MKPVLTLSLGFLLAIGVTGCRDSGAGDYMALDGKVFVFNYRVATARYLVNLKPLRPQTGEWFAVASFEDPAGGSTIAVREKIWPQVTRTTLNSPPVHCIVKDKPYQVSILIEDNAGTVLQEIDTTVTSSQDQSDLPDKPLVIGPLYTPNPEVAGHPGGDLPDNGGVKCPG